MSNGFPSVSLVAQSFWKSFNMLSSIPEGYSLLSESLTLVPVDITTSLSENPEVDLQIEVQRFTAKCR